MTAKRTPPHGKRLGQNQQTWPTDIPLKLGDKRVPIRAWVDYEFTPPMPATETDPACGGVEIVGITAVIGNVLVSVADFEGEPWYDELVDELYRDCGLNPEDR